MLGLCRHVFPHAESHKFFIEHWGTSLFFNAIRKVGAVLAENGFFPEADDIFYLNIHEVHEALSDVGLAWAGGAAGRGTVYWPQRVERRKEILATLAEWVPPPALGVVPEVINDPDRAAALGRHRRPAARLGERGGRRRRRARIRRLARRRRGPRARRARRERDRDGAAGRGARLLR